MFAWGQSFSEPQFTGPSKNRSLASYGSSKVAGGVLACPEASPGNRRPPGYEPEPGGGGLKQEFQPFEGATRCSVSPSPTRLIRKYEPKSTSCGVGMSTWPRLPRSLIPWSIVNRHGECRADGVLGQDKDGWLALPFARSPLEKVIGAPSDPAKSPV